MNLDSYSPVVLAGLFLFAIGLQRKRGRLT